MIEVRYADAVRVWVVIYLHGDTPEDVVRDAEIRNDTPSAVALAMLAAEPPANDTTPKEPTMNRPAIFLTHITWRLASKYSPPPDEVVYVAEYEALDGVAYPTMRAVPGRDVIDTEYWTEDFAPSGLL